MYNLGIYLFSFLLKFLGYFNTKIKSGVIGRRNTFDVLAKAIKKDDLTFWFHCASLGEYEQGLPVFEKLRQDHPDHKIVLTFFSPSGYEVRKNTDVADVVVYLPLDTKTNAKRFLELVHPELTIFVKYDIWPNLLIELNRQDRRAILISAHFRKNQSYFKFYGGKRKTALLTFEHIFVQNESSKSLLNSIDYDNVTVSGDTRFDRVSNQLKLDNALPFVATFKAESTCVVIGSSWPEDEALLIPYINAHASERLKFIIAPHEINSNHITTITSKLQKDVVCYSQKDDSDLTKAKVFIVDTIGLLSKIYSYADIAYVGGAMGHTGLHNILEPAVFGVPIIIGQHYEKFPEASLMIKEAGVISIKNHEELTTVLDLTVTSESYRKTIGVKNAAFIEKNRGAVVQIIDYIRI